MSSPDYDPLYTAFEAARLLNVSASTLAKWRMEPGRGPEFLRLSRRLIRYRKSALDRFAGGHCETEV